MKRPQQMELPARTRRLISDNLSKLSPTPVDRYLIYKSFGFSRLYQPSIGLREYDLIKQSVAKLTSADYVIFWLAKLTIEKVLPLWNRIFESVSPDEILELATKVLFEDPEDVTQLIELYDILGLSIPGLLNTYATHLIESATYNLLYNILYSARVSYDKKKFLKYYEKIEQEGQIDYAYGNDFAGACMQAFCVENVTAPGDWVNYLNTKTPLISFNSQKRLEFWEWWLTEAIPQAWELANQTYKEKGGR